VIARYSLPCETCCGREADGRRRALIFKTFSRMLPVLALRRAAHVAARTASACASPCFCATTLAVPALTSPLQLVADSLRRNTSTASATEEVPAPDAVETSTASSPPVAEAAPAPAQPAAELALTEDAAAGVQTPADAVVARASSLNTGPVLSALSRAAPHPAAREVAAGRGMSDPAWAEAVATLTRRLAAATTAAERDAALLPAPAQPQSQTDAAPPPTAPVTWGDLEAAAADMNRGARVRQGESARRLAALVCSVAGHPTPPHSSTTSAAADASSSTSSSSPPPRSPPSSPEGDRAKPKPKPKAPAGRPSSSSAPAAAAAAALASLTAADLAAVRAQADLRQPHLWYPAARAMKRRLIYHAGPTNSGKTYNALNALKESWAGVYCGPLRLLALEVFESLNFDSTPCSLMTGQDKRTMPFARHVACTVEMVDVERQVDVAVIDEIQMIGDDGRGAAWTRAVLGVPAREVHLCGDPAAIPAVTALAAITGDELEVRRYDRMTTLNLEARSLEGDYSKVEEGDAVVAFSRKDIYAIRRHVERTTKLKCCVVYGSLPPETRSAQARLFNDPNSGHRVLIASDAIGMGLNLNIRRVVFHTMQKYDGTSVGLVEPSMVKQIAGRAGRRNSIYPAGYATTLNAADGAHLAQSLATPTEPIASCGLFPNPEQLVAFSALLPRGTPLGKIVDAFLGAATMEGPYFLCKGDDMRTMADILHPFPMPLELRATLLLAPINTRNPDIRAWYISFIEQYTRGGPVRLNVQLPMWTPPAVAGAASSAAGDPNLVRPSPPPQISGVDIEALEAKAAALDIYLWLAHRLGGSVSFADTQEAASKRVVVGDMLESALVGLSQDAQASSRKRARDETRALVALMASGGGGGARMQMRPTLPGVATAGGAASLVGGGGGGGGGGGRMNPRHLLPPGSPSFGGMRDGRRGAGPRGDDGKRRGGSGQRPAPHPHHRTTAGGAAGAGGVGSGGGGAVLVEATASA
jgi:hypothetical protein